MTTRKEREKLFSDTYNKLLNLIPDKPKEVVAAMTAQLMIESSWGTYRLAKNHNNWGGIKTGTSWQGRAVKNPDDGLTYRSYDSFDHFALDLYNNVILNGHHDEAAHATTARGYAEGLMVGPTTYATNPRYSHLIMEIYEDYTSNMDLKTNDAEVSNKLDAIPLTREDVLKLITYHENIAAGHRMIANVYKGKL